MQTQFFKRPEGTLAYSDYGGSGELVLMLPGMGALRSEYRFLAPRLSQAGYRAVDVDLRGHGDSSVPWNVYDVPAVGNDILELIDYFNAGAAHLICTSFAGAAAVWAAVERPSAVRSMVLIGAVVRTPKISPLMNAAFWLMMNNPWRVRLWGMYYGMLYPTQKPPDFEDYRSHLLKNLAEPGRFEAAKRLANSSRDPSEQRLNQVQTPTLVIMGTKDPDFPNPDGEAQFLASQTDGKVFMVDGAGHYPQTEMPEVTAPLVINFLSESANQPAVSTDNSPDQA